MTVSRSWSAVIIATLALVLLPTLAMKEHRAAATAGPYVVTDLGTFGAVQSAQAHAINEAGQVVGYAAGHAFLWQNGVMTDRGTIGGTASVGYAINAFGQIAGSSTITSGSTAHPVLWQNGAITDLTPGIPANEGGSANAINDSGQVVGTLNYWVPFLWQNGVRTNLGHLGGGGGSASDINNAGQIVGSSYTTIWSELLGPIQHAVLWENARL